MATKIPFKFLRHVPSAPVPLYSTPASAGFDISAIEEQVIFPYQITKKVCFVRTGLKVAFPEGYELQIRQRSGLSVKYPNYLANGIATIDADYRGEILLPIVNWTQEPWLILVGDRIAQGIVNPITQVDFQDMTTRTGVLPETSRGEGGFGSTGR